MIVDKPIFTPRMGMPPRRLELNRRLMGQS